MSSLEEEQELSPSEAGVLVLRLSAAQAALDWDVPSRVHALTGVLDKSSTLLARSAHARQNIGNTTSPSIWPLIRQLWVETLEAHTLPDLDATTTRLLADVVVSLAKFTRNLVAANEDYQAKAYTNEPLIRKLTYHYSSYAASQDPVSYPVTRLLAQTLSNLVTRNDALSDELWSIYLDLPEEQLILTRLLASPDARTLSSTFVLILNCVHDSVPRTRMLSDSPRGPRLCVSLLDRISSLFEAADSSEEGRAFDLGYEIFRRVIEAGLCPTLYKKLAMDLEAITPHQTTLLRLIDSYLHGCQLAHEVALTRKPEKSGERLLDVLILVFISLAVYASSSIQRALGPGKPSSGDVTDAAHSDGDVEKAVGASPSGQATQNEAPLQELDLLLPKVCEALVLAAQCLTTITLRAEEAGATRPVSLMRDTDAKDRSPRTIIAHATTPDGQGFVECLVDTLRCVDAFVPRITFGKVVQRPPSPSGHVVSDAPATQMSSDARVSADSRGTIRSDPEAILAAGAFAHVKRDLVRLLGILAEGERAVQDRTRVCGGIPVVMNLCVVDDYNPYMREHAIFALRNLLFGNAENQAVVEKVKPIGRWDEDKVLRDLGRDTG